MKRLRYAIVRTGKYAGHWKGKYGKIVGGRLEKPTSYITVPYWTLFFQYGEQFEFPNGEIEILSYDESDSERNAEIAKQAGW